MQVNYVTDPIEFIYVDNTYTEEEIEFIFLELEYLRKTGSFTEPKNIGSAKDENSKEFLKKAKGLFLDTVFINRNMSVILNVNRKLYTIEPPSNFKNPIFKGIKECNKDFTLLSYYENSDYYRPHVDNSVLTFLTYLYKKPKKFSGGGIVIPEYNLTLDPVFNRTYIIPGLLTHSVNEIFMDEVDMGKGFGRYCISNFLNFKD